MHEMPGTQGELRPLNFVPSAGSEGDEIVGSTAA